MHSNIYCKSDESADIVDMALCVESEECGFKPCQPVFFYSYFCQGLNIAKNMFLLLLFFHHVASNCSGHFMRIMHQSFVTTAPRPGGGLVIAGQISWGFLLLHSSNSGGGVVL